MLTNNYFNDAHLSRCLFEESRETYSLYKLAFLLKSSSRGKFLFDVNARVCICKERTYNNGRTYALGIFNISIAKQ